MSVLALVSSDCTSALDLVAVWLDAGRSVQVVLLDAAAATVRPNHVGGAHLERVIDAGAVVGVHDEAAARRGITSAGMVAGIKTLTLDEVADLIGDATGTVVWL